MIKVEAVQRPDGIRFSAAVRPHDDPRFYEKSGLFHAVQPRQARHHPRSRPSRRARVRRSSSSRRPTSWWRTSRRGSSSSSGSTTRPCGRCDPTSSCCGCPRSASTVRGATARGSRRRWNRSPAWRGSPATRAARRSSRAASSTRWWGRTPRWRSSPRSSIASAPAKASSSRSRLIEVATAVTAEQVIRYSDRRHVGRPAGRGRRVRSARRPTTWVAVDRARDPMSPRRACGVVHRRARPKRRPRTLGAQGIPAAAVVPAYTALDDPQLQARGFFEPVEHVDRRRAALSDLADADVGRSRDVVDRSGADAR